MRENGVVCRRDKQGDVREPHDEEAFEEHAVSVTVVAGFADLIGDSAAGLLGEKRRERLIE